MMSHQRHRKLMVVVIFGIVVFLSWWFFTEYFIADDSYFYLVISRNIVLFQEQTFSHVTPTNGVHPLWLYILIIWTGIVKLINPEWIYSVRFIVPLAFLLLVCGVFNFYVVAKKLNLRALAFVIVLYGYLSVFGVLGSEAHMLFFALSCLTRFTIYTKDKNKLGIGQQTLLGLGIAVVFLSRLDSVFFLACFVVWYVFDNRSVSTVFRILVFAAIPIILYLTSNYIIFGGFNPISGWLKATFPATHLTGVTIAGLATTFSGYSILSGYIPIGISLLCIAFVRHSLNDKTSIVLVYFLGSVFHMLYTALFTSGYTAWPWYYVFPIITVSIAITLVFNAYNVPDMVTTIYSGISILVFAGFLIFKLISWVPNIGDQTLTYIRENQIQDQAILVSDYPGKIAYFSSNYILAADMLTANRRFVDDMLESENALDFLFEAARKASRDISYIFWIGNRDWLSVDESLKTMSYNNPQDKKSPIGVLDVGSPIFVDTSVPMIVWQLPSTN